jgi:hypothetical protein
VNWWPWRRKKAVYTPPRQAVPGLPEPGALRQSISFDAYVDMAVPVWIGYMRTRAEALGKLDAYRELVSTQGITTPLGELVALVRRDPDRWMDFVTYVAGEAFRPGGVKVLGRHWCEHHPGGCAAGQCPTCHQEAP